MRMDRIGTTTVVKNAFPLAPTVQRVAEDHSHFAKHACTKGASLVATTVM